MQQSTNLPLNPTCLLPNEQKITNSMLNVLSNRTQNRQVIKLITRVSARMSSGYECSFALLFRSQIFNCNALDAIDVFRIANERNRLKVKNSIEFSLRFSMIWPCFYFVSKFRFFFVYLSAMVISIFFCCFLIFRFYFGTKQMNATKMVVVQLWLTFQSECVSSQQSTNNVSFLSLL